MYGTSFADVSGTGPTQDWAKMIASFKAKDLSVNLTDAQIVIY